MGAAASVASARAPLHQLALASDGAACHENAGKGLRLSNGPPSGRASNSDQDARTSAPACPKRWPPDLALLQVPPLLDRCVVLTGEFPAVE